MSHPTEYLFDRHLHVTGVWPHHHCLPSLCARARGVWVQERCTFDGKSWFHVKIVWDNRFGEWKNNPPELLEPFWKVRTSTPGLEIRFDDSRIQAFPTLFFWVTIFIQEFPPKSAAASLEVTAKSRLCFALPHNNLADVHGPTVAISVSLVLLGSRCRWAQGSTQKKGLPFFCVWKQKKLDNNWIRTCLSPGTFAKIRCLQPITALSIQPWYLWNSLRQWPIGLNIWS